MENKEKISTKLVNGKEIEYRDVIHSHVTINFGWKDRIKILLGRRARVHVTIYTMHDYCQVSGSESKIYVDVLFPKKSNGMIEISPANPTQTPIGVDGIKK